MFQALRQGNQVYILYKSDSPVLKIGIVQSVSAPLSYYGGASTVDINVKVDNDNLDFKHLPATLSIANYNNSDIVISESKETMVSEVEGMIRVSKDVLNHIPYHEKVIIEGEQMLRQLNTQYAKQKDQEEKINNLETKIGGIESKLDNISELLTKSLGS